MRNFTKYFSAIATPLTNISKAKTSFKWTSIDQEDFFPKKRTRRFQETQNAVCSQVLELPNFTKLFEIHLMHLMWRMVQF